MNNADAVKVQITQLLNEHPELAEDNTLLMDMLEGETEIMVVVRQLLLQHAEDTMLIGGIMERKKQLDVRKGRLEHRIETMRATMASLLNLLPDGQKTLRLAEATVSYKKAGAGKAFVHDLDMLPQGFYRTKKEADLVAIGAALKAGEEVPGAQLMPGKDGVTIRNT